MEVGILHPQDCLKRNHHHQRRSLISPANKPRRNVNPNSNTNLKRRNSQSPPPSNGSTNKAQQSRPKSPPLVGPVRFIKRGEEISLPPPNPEPKPEPRPALPGSMVDEFHLRQAKFRYRRSSPGETVGLLTEMLIHMKSLVSSEES
ncbi:Dedicator of cytokinesis protein 2 [Bienertia sinuspersici]